MIIKIRNVVDNTYGIHFEKLKPFLVLDILSIFLTDKKYLEYYKIQKTIRL
jgi:hypothetical protein